MKNENSQIDKYFISFLLMIMFMVICILYIRFLSIFLVMPCIICIIIFIKYIHLRNINVWQDSKKIIYSIISIFIIFAFISKSLFQTFEFIEALKGYCKTNVLQISYYEKIDFSKNVSFPAGYKTSQEINRDLYILKPYNLEQTLKYADEIIGFLGTPVLYEFSQNIYHVETNYNNKQNVTFIIHFLGSYNLIEVQT